MTHQPLNLDAIQARADAALEGPWAVVESDQCVWATDDYRIVVDKSTWDPDEWLERGQPDAEFIAHARTDVPALIARIRELEAHNARLHTAYVNALTNGERWPR